MIIAKYKLIKEYPGRKIGDIACYNPEVCEDRFIWGDGTKVPKSSQPDLFPNFFEEINKFTILSFTNIKGDIIWNRNGNDDKFTQGTSMFGFTQKDLLKGGEINVKSGHIFIHSIRRDCDGIVFTLGDRVGSYSYIKSIVLEKDNYEVPWVNLCTKGGGESGGVSFWVVDLFQGGKPFLITEDGVEIFNGDKFYATYKRGLILNNPLECEAHHSFGINVWTGCYSTEKLARQHIYSILSQKLFSYNDIQNMFDFDTDKGNDQLLKKFINKNIS